jgi:hypothetical protein
VFLAFFLEWGFGNSGFFQVVFPDIFGPLGGEVVVCGKQAANRSCCSRFDQSTVGYAYVLRSENACQRAGHA